MTNLIALGLLAPVPKRYVLPRRLVGQWDLQLRNAVEVCEGGEVRVNELEPLHPSVRRHL